MPHNLFGFEESDFGDLHWIPLAMRFRLDVCGLKLPLISWQTLPLSERIGLLDYPFGRDDQKTLWSLLLKQALALYGLEEPNILEPWIDLENIPADVLKKLEDFGCSLSEIAWQGLKPLQRYSLCKIARGKQADRYLFSAYREFSQ